MFACTYTQQITFGRVRSVQFARGVAQSLQCHSNSASGLPSAELLYHFLEGQVPHDRQFSAFWLAVSSCIWMPDGMLGCQQQYQHW